MPATVFLFVPGELHPRFAGNPPVRLLGNRRVSQTVETQLHEPPPLAIFLFISLAFREDARPVHELAKLPAQSVRSADLTPTESQEQRGFRIIPRRDAAL